MIVVLGSSGYVGSAFCRALSARGENYRTLSRQQIDYTRPERLVAFLQEVAASFVINCAGYTGKPNVDACETDRANCLEGNAVLPGRLGEACEAVGIPFGHVSSGCIFSGRTADGQGFTEESIPNFSFRSNHCSFYSGTKALGEEALGYGIIEGEQGPVWGERFPVRGYVWRLRIPFDHRDGARNYLSKLMRYERLLEAENSVSHLGDFVDAALECWRQGLPFGIYNITNPGSVTTRQVVQMIREAAEKAGTLEGLPKQFDFYQSEAEFMARAALTPRSNCVLDTQKLRKKGVVMRPVEEAIRDSLSRWEPEPAVASNA